MLQQPTLFQLIKKFKFFEAVNAITANNVNEREDISVQITYPNGIVSNHLAKNINALEALCFVTSVIYSANFSALNEKLPALKLCINKTYIKMESYNTTIWNEKDGIGNSTSQWLAWGGASKVLEKLLNKHPELVDIEKNSLRNAFDVAIEVEHLNIEQKKELAKVLIPLGIKLNCLAAYKMLSNNFVLLKDNELESYLNPDKKQENQQILESLVISDGKIDSKKLIAPLIKKLLEHKPPLFENNLDNTKAVITNKILQDSMNAKIIPTDEYAAQVTDLTSCLIYIQHYEQKQMIEAIGVSNLSLGD